MDKNVDSQDDRIGRKRVLNGKEGCEGIKQYYEFKGRREAGKMREAGGVYSG